MDMYGISSAAMDADSLHGKIALERQNAQDKYDAATKLFNQRIQTQKQNDSRENDEDIAKDSLNLQSIYGTGKGVYGGISGAAAGASEAYSSARAGSGVVRGVAPAFLGGGADVSAGSGVLRSLGSGAAGGAKGFVSGLNEAGGGLNLPEALGGSGLKGITKSVAGGGEGLGGIEGVIQKGLVSKGASEEAAFVGGKAFGALGGLITGGEQIDSLIESGGKSAFTRVNAQGKRVEESGTDKAGEILSEAGAALDVASAFTGGLLVPFAAAVNLAGAVTSVVGSYEDEKTDDKNVGLKSDGTVDDSAKPTKPSAPAAAAYTSLGFVGNMSHNPLANIA